MKNLNTKPALDASNASNEVHTPHTPTHMNPKNPTPNFTEKMLALSAKLRHAGHMIASNPKLGAASLAITVMAAVIIGGFSQDSGTTGNPESAEKTWVKPTLPVERTLTSTDGRKIEGTVLENLGNALQFRRNDGKEFTISFDKLSQNDIEWAQGPKAKPSEPTLREAPYDFKIVAYNRGIHQYDAFVKKGDKIQIIEENDDYLMIKWNGHIGLVISNPNGEKYTLLGIGPKENALTYSYINNRIKVQLQKTRNPYIGLTNYEPTKTTYYGYIKEGLLDTVDSIHMMPNNTKEYVSLKEKFKELGVIPKKQVGPTCTLYAMHHLCEYYKKSGKMPNYSFEQFKANAEKTRIHQLSQSYDPESLIEVIAKTYTKNFKLKFGEDELIKHEIRNGRPVLAATVVNQYMHAVIVVGFKTDDQKHTTWEILDSNLPGYRNEWDIGSAHAIEFY